MGGRGSSTPRSKSAMGAWKASHFNSKDSSSAIRTAARNSAGAYSTMEFTSKTEVGGTKNFKVTKSSRENRWFDQNGIEWTNGDMEHNVKRYTKLNFK